MKTFKLASTTGMFAIAAMLSTQAHADNLRYTSNVNAVTVSSPNTLAVPLNNAGATTINFTNPTAGLVAITFSAECAVSSTQVQSWANLDILVDGGIVSPTESDNAFCTAIAPDGVEIWSTNSITVARNLSAGQHSVSVNANFGFGSGTIRLDDIALHVAR